VLPVHKAHGGQRRVAAQRIRGQRVFGRRRLIASRGCFGLLGLYAFAGVALLLGKESSGRKPAAGAILGKGTQWLNRAGREHGCKQCWHNDPHAVPCQSPS
jgi:hypothetical protein